MFLSDPADPKEEANLLMKAFKAILSEADMTMDDLVYVTVYCPDLSLYSAFNEVYSTYFEKDFPARAFVGSGTLLFGIRFRNARDCDKIAWNSPKQVDAG